MKIAYLKYGILKARMKKRTQITKVLRLNLIVLYYIYMFTKFMYRLIFILRPYTLLYLFMKPLIGKLTIFSLRLILQYFS